MNQLFQLTDKVAIVTGGAKGIGKAVVEVFCQQGAIVHFLDIDLENSKKLTNDLEKKDYQVYFHPCDVSDHKAVSSTFTEIEQFSGSFDILINNAGIASIGDVLQTDEDEMDRIYAVNIKSVYNCLHHGVQLMKKSGGGVIINLGSVASVVGLSNRFAYSMSKGAVYSMTYSVAKDYIDENIRCNAIGPGRVHTPFVDGYLKKNYPGQEEEMFEHFSKTQPIGRMAQPKEIAYLINYLCSEEASFITGSFYPIDGGFMTLNT